MGNLHRNKSSRPAPITVTRLVSVLPLLVLLLLPSAQLNASSSATVLGSTIIPTLAAAPYFNTANMTLNAAPDFVTSNVTGRIPQSPSLTAFNTTLFADFGAALASLINGTPFNGNETWYYSQGVLAVVVVHTPANVTAWQAASTTGTTTQSATSTHVAPEFPVGALAAIFVLTIGSVAILSRKQAHEAWT
jgi:hypothetical protein